jgi:hypothetical protein
MSDKGTELSDAIKAVREGLMAAQQDGQSSALRFTVKEVVLDLAVDWRASGSASGGVKAFVMSADAKGEWSKDRTHRLSVTLEVSGADHTLISGHTSEFGDTVGPAPFA